mgnify:CR=1 FL=1
MEIDDVKEQSANVEMNRPTAWLEAWPETLVVGQLGQSLDGRIATPTGHSHYINGLPSRRFLHQLRAHVDAVVIGVGTALADQPQLTVRHVEGKNPARVILDPSARINADNPVLSDDGTPVWVVIAESTQRPAWPSHIQTLSLPLANRGYDPKALLTALRATELKRVLIEGGPSTLSAFISAQCMDRLYCLIAPMIIGSGPAGIELPPIDQLEEAIRAPMRSCNLDGEWLVEVELNKPTT